MREISNSSLALLVALAIVISVAGSLMSLSKLNQLGAAGLTGMLSTSTTASGTANLTVPALAFVNLTDNLIAFGTLNVDRNNASDNIDDWWIARNDGTVNISIRIYSDSGDDQDGNGSASTGRGPFSSSTTSSGCLNQGALKACFMVKCQNSTAVDGSSSNGSICNTTYESLPVNGDGAGSRLLMTDLLSVDGNDTAWFGVNVTVPQAEPSGDKDQTVEFLAAAS